MKIIIVLVLSLTLFHYRPTKIGSKPAVSNCYGNNPCAACSNCSRCKHCGAGGSCGVCSAKSLRNINMLFGAGTPGKKTAAYVGQCRAMTKKGSQCKRNGNGSGYCWQHKK